MRGLSKESSAIMKFFVREREGDAEARGWRVAREGCGALWHWKALEVREDRTWLKGDLP